MTVRSSKKFEVLGHGKFFTIFLTHFMAPMPYPIGPKMTHFWPYPRGSPPWFGAITVNSIFCPNRWPWSRWILGHGNFLRRSSSPKNSNRWPRSSQKFLGHGPQLAPIRGSPPWFGAITVNSIFCPNCFDPFFFLPQWDPIGPKMYPRGSPLWFGAITVNSIFCPNRIWGHGFFTFLTQKWPEFWGMEIF